MPTYTTFGSDGATAIAPIDPVSNELSETFVHVLPASSVRQTPPALPMKKLCGRPGTPVTVVERPPREGPTIR